jgi:nucleotidyltransferase-like protein
MIITEKMIRDTLLIDKQSRDSYLLYGSYARGDYGSSSDVDVLRITTSRRRSQGIDGRASLHIYDIKDLLGMARQGSLFILHLVREAKPIHDPCGYLGDLSAAFQKPDSYTSVARRMIGPASALLDIGESLFETAPQRFMDATLFLCRTLVYAEHADRGPFSFSLRELAAEDKTALMICNIKDQSVSYSDFRHVRQVVRSKIECSPACLEALSINELSQRSQGNPLFDSLLRRIVEGDGDPYLMPTSMAANNSLERAERVSQ